MQNTTSSVNQVLNTHTVNTVNSKINNLNNSIQFNSKQYKALSNTEITRIFANLHDLIPDDGYTGFYINKLKTLGLDRFMELAQKARAGSDTPQRLFCWMLKNHENVN